MLSHMISFSDPHLLMHCQDCCTVPTTAPIYMNMYGAGVYRNLWVCLWSKQRSQLPVSYVRLICLAMPCWRGLTRLKRLSMAATPWVMGFAHPYRFWPNCEDVLCDHCFQMVITHGCSEFVENLVKKAPFTFKATGLASQLWLKVHKHP